LAFWTRRGGTRDSGAEAPNSNPASDVGGGSGVSPGDPDGVVEVGERSFSAPLAYPWPSPWSGWPSDWATPDWTQTGNLGLSRLIDTAWACIDLNASVSSSFSAYRLKNGQIMAPPSYLINPDPSIYTSWSEFIKQLVWDYQLGEAFVLPMASDASGKPLRFRVIPPWLMNVALIGGRREYHVGGLDVTDEILHIRNISSTADAHGHGPLEAAGARMTTAGLLQRYAHNLAETGGVPNHWLDVPGRKLTQTEANDLLDQWVESRRRHAGGPSILSGGADLKQAQTMSARDLTLLELQQFSESRIAVLSGVPPYLVGLPSAQGEQMNYANIAQLFDHHARAGLRPKIAMIMGALSGWLLPRGQSLELNSDEYDRPDMLARAQAYQIYLTTGVLSTPEVRAMERFDGIPSAASAVTGAELSGGSDTVTATEEPARELEEEGQLL
jgi:HK97 family phage portal protein